MNKGSSSSRNKEIEETNRNSLLLVPMYVRICKKILCPSDHMSKVRSMAGVSHIKLKE